MMELRLRIDSSLLDTLIREHNDIPEGYKLKSVTLWGSNNSASVVYFHEEKYAKKVVGNAIGKVLE